MLCLCLCLVALLCVLPHALKAHSIHSLCTLYRGFVMRVRITHFFTNQPMGRLICCSLAARMTFCWLCGALSQRSCCVWRGAVPLFKLFPLVWDWPRGAATAPSPPAQTRGVTHPHKHGQNHTRPPSSDLTHTYPRPGLPWSLVKSVL